jgi:hypothetical protein
MQIMNRKTMRACVLLAGAAMWTAAAAAQRAALDLGLTFGLEHSQVAQTGSPGFWLKGASVDGAYSFYHGLGMAAEFGGSHADISPGVQLGKYTFLAGPRYTGQTKLKPMRVFGETLFGFAHGFDALFPSGAGTTPTANAFAMQAGGGVNFQLQHGFGVRPIEMDYVHTTLPNNAANSQNDFRVAFGMTYRFKRDN